MKRAFNTLVSRRTTQVKPVYERLTPRELPEVVEFLGHEVVRDDEDVRGHWHYCIIFPLVGQGIPQSAASEKMMSYNAMHELLQLFFRPCVIENETGEFDYLKLIETFQEEMVRFEFEEAVRFVIATILAGPHMGLTLQASPSIDEDELFLKVRLEEGQPIDLEGNSWFQIRSKKYNTIQQLADAVDLRMTLNPDSYPPGFACPTRQLNAKRNFEGNAFLPAALAYTKERKEFFNDFSDLDIMRLIRLRMNQLLNWDHLKAHGIVLPNGFFAVHRWRHSSMFAQPLAEVAEDAQSWPNGFASASWRDIAQWPGDQHLAYVKEYFGEEIAFFFHWLNFFTEMLMYPAACCCLIGFLRLWPYFQSEQAGMILDVTFMAVMILWSSSFLEIYKRKMHFYIEAWGMRDYQAQEVGRPSFKKELIGTFREEARQIAHWFGIVVVVIWTVGVNYQINSHRAMYLHNPKKKFIFGLRGETLQTLAKYLVTINITVVDSVWGALSPAWSKKENHRTPVELRDAMVLKLIVVKVFVYYYPFWYIAFVQKYVEGCNVGGVTCEEYLVESLIIFVLLHIIWVMGAAYMSVLGARWKIDGELQDTGRTQYSYLEAQAKCPPYDPEVEIADFLELITSLGLVMQFSIIVPVIPLLQLLSNLMEIRINAYKMVNIYQRVEGRGSEGIGSWAHSVYGITWLALVVNVGLGVFFMAPMKHWDVNHQIFTFVIVEHVLIAIKVLVEAFIPDVDVLTRMVMHTNNTVVDHIFSGDKGARVMVQGPGQIPCMSMKYNPSFFADEPMGTQMCTVTPHGLVSLSGEESPWLAAPIQHRTFWRFSGVTLSKGLSGTVSSTTTGISDACGLRGRHKLIPTDAGETSQLSSPNHETTMAPLSHESTMILPEAPNATTIDPSYSTYPAANKPRDE